MPGRLDGDAGAELGAGVTERPIPTANDINVHGSLDEEVACDHFLGKTLDEAEALFRANSLYYQEDLMWMGPRAFVFSCQLRSAISGAPNRSRTAISSVSCLPSSSIGRIRMGSSRRLPRRRCREGEALEETSSRATSSKP